MLTLRTILDTINVSEKRRGNQQWTLTTYGTRHRTNKNKYILLRGDNVLGDSFFQDKSLPGRHWTCIFSPWFIFECLSMPCYITSGYIQIILYKWIVMRYVIRDRLIHFQISNVFKLSNQSVVKV